MSQLLMFRPAASRPELRRSDATVRSATDEDANGLARLLSNAFPEMDWSAERVQSELLDPPDVVATFVADIDGVPVATASARHHPQFADLGYVHWVGVDPARRGAGLFDLMMQQVLNHFDQSGRPAAVLETDDVRLAAITAYLRLGFVPRYRDPDHEARWSDVFKRLGEARRAARASSRQP